MDKKHRDIIVVTLAAAIITGLCAICAATIGLGVPIVEKVLDTKVTPTDEFSAPLVPAIVVTPSAIPPLNLPIGVEIFPGEYKKVYSINWQSPNDRTVDIIDIYVQCLSCSEQDFLVTKSTGYYEHPTWSPQGTMIAALKGKCGNQSLVVLSSDGSWEETIPNVFPDCLNISWSPLGDEIAYSSNGALLAVNINTGQTRIIATAEKIQNKDSGINGIYWSPDGKKLTFWTRLGLNGNDETGWTIWVVNSNGTNLVKIPPPNGYGQMSSHWVINQDQLIFLKFQMNGGNRGDYELWTINSDGTNSQIVEGSVSIKANLYFPGYLECNSTTAIYCNDFPWEPDDFDDDGQPTIIGP